MRYKILFPSPQGGSETGKVLHKVLLFFVSIPSRRVGDHSSLARASSICDCFHPLKAGRRHYVYPREEMEIEMFPSPQGGSETWRWRRRMEAFMLRFPSPQGGSETTRRRYYMRYKILFPSPQGGSETQACHLKATFSHRVSIPSRRVGDTSDRQLFGRACKFPSPQGGSETHV